MMIFGFILVAAIIYGSYHLIRSFPHDLARRKIEMEAGEKWEREQWETKTKKLV
jgi:hypothetical protein